MARTKSQGWVPGIEGMAGPIYLAIADAIATAVASGALRAGERLPTHRAMAEALGVDLTTVTRAYGEATRRGLLQATVGRGSFVRGAAPSARDGEGTVDLGMNLPPLPEGIDLPDLLRQGLSRVLAEPGDRLTYRRGHGSAAERAAGVAWLRPVLGEVDPARVLLCPGAQPALLALLGSLAGPGDVVLTEPLVYSNLRAAAAQLGLRLVGVEIDGLEAACRAHRPRAYCCIPTMQNPTAATMTPAQRQAVAEIARRHALPVIEDDAYGLLPTAPLPAITALLPELGYYVSTVSKVLTPALRQAFLVVPDGDRAARLGAALRANVLMAAPLLSGVLADWIQDGTAGVVLKAIRRECAARQALARAILPAGSFDAHPEGLHLWLRLPPRWGRLDFAAHLRRQGGLAVVPSDAFAVGEPVEAVRVSLGAAPGREALAGALRAVAAALRDEAAPSFAEVV